jgi:hypothetical protein
MNHKLNIAQGAAESNPSGAGADSNSVETRHCLVLQTGRALIILRKNKASASKRNKVQFRAVS